MKTCPSRPVLLRQAGFEADTVAEEYLSGADDSTVADAVRSGVRVLVTLDRDFGDIRNFLRVNMQALSFFGQRARTKLRSWLS